jgi:hypothetical protein
MAGPPEMDPAELKPLAQDRFHLERFGGEVEFTAEPGGGMSIKVTQADGTGTGGRVALSPPDLKNLAEYAGVYWSPELETQYTIFVRDGKLFADHVRHGEIALKPVAKDEFSGSWFMRQVKFLRDNAGRITGLTMGGGRVTGIRFNRTLPPRS